MDHEIVVCEPDVQSHLVAYYDQVKRTSDTKVEVGSLPLGARITASDGTK